MKKILLFFGTLILLITGLIWYLNIYYWDTDKIIMNYKINEYTLELYQTREFGSSQPLLFQVKNSYDSIIKPMCFIIGTTERLDKESITITVIDSIVFISFSDRKEGILALFDTRNEYCYPDCSNLNADWLVEMNKWENILNRYKLKPYK